MVNFHYVYFTTMKKKQDMNVHSSTIHNSQKVGTIQTSNNW